MPTRCHHQHNGKIYSQPRTASCRSQLSWSHQCPVSGTLALSAGQAGPRLRARSGLDGEGKKAEEEGKAKRKNKEEPVSWSWAFHLWNRKRGTGKVWVTRRCPVDAGDTLGLRLPWRVGRRQRITGSGSHVARAEGSMAGMHHKPAFVPGGSQWGISSPEVIPTRGAWTPPWKKGPAGAPASAGMSS